MILVDTSVLIDYLKNVENDKGKLFQEILERKIPYGISNIIYLEVLQGSKTEKEFHLIREYLGSLPFFELLEERVSYEKTAKMNYKCRRAGITVRSTIDLVISQIAMENNLALLHNDSDFDNIAKVYKELITCKSPDINIVRKRRAVQDYQG